MKRGDLVSMWRWNRTCGPKSKLPAIGEILNIQSLQNCDSGFLVTVGFENDHNRVTIDKNWLDVYCAIDDMFTAITP